MPVNNKEFLEEIRVKALFNTCALAKDADDARTLAEMLGLLAPIEEVTYHGQQEFYPKGI